VDTRFRETHGVRLGAIVLDTLAATFAIEDENNNSKAAAVIRAMKVMSDALGVVVLPPSITSGKQPRRACGARVLGAPVAMWC
jgi:hypothetical protein